MTATASGETVNRDAGGMSSPAVATGRWERTAWEVGEQVAAKYADEVDRNARFPHESVEELKRREIFSAMIPTELGGGGATMSEMVGAIRALAYHCTATALVVAMHTVEIVNLTRYGTTEPLRGVLREISAKQLVIASANSEVGLGGEATRSICAVEKTDRGLWLDKHALAISYGQHADLITSTARRSPESEQTEQSLVVLRAADATLEPTSVWDTLGLRGTCSMSFQLSAPVDADLVFPETFSVIATNGGLQAGMVLLSAVWVGLAEASAARAHAFVRAAARRAIGTVPPAALRLAELGTQLQQSRSILHLTALRFEELARSGELDSPEFLMSVRNLKVTTSQLGLDVATAALGITGIAGFQRESPFSMDRLVRDAHGGLVMVSNDRYLRANAELLIARKQI